MSVTGVKVEPNCGKQGGSAAESGSDSDSSDDDDDDDSEKGEESTTSAFKNSHRPRDESPNSKRVSFIILRHIKFLPFGQTTAFKVDLHILIFS
jgi:hypothetical protein